MKLFETEILCMKENTEGTNFAHLNSYFNQVLLYIFYWIHNVAFISLIPLISISPMLLIKGVYLC